MDREVNRFERQFLEIKNTAHKSGIGEVGVNITASISFPDSVYSGSIYRSSCHDFVRGARAHSEKWDRFSKPDARRNKNIERFQRFDINWNCSRVSCALLDQKDRSKTLFLQHNLS